MESTCIADYWPNPLGILREERRKFKSFVSILRDQLSIGYDSLCTDVGRGSRKSILRGPFKLFTTTYENS